MENVEKKYPKLTGAGGSKGTDYQIKLLQFFLLQSSYNKTRTVSGIDNNKDFILSTENEHAGNFDDVVYETEKPILLQAKHKSKKEEKRINFEQLFPKSQEGEFCLITYLKKFPTVIKNFAKIGNIILCTNAQFNLEGINNSLNNVIKTKDPIVYLKDEKIIHPISDIKNTKCYSFDQNNELVKYISENLPANFEDVIRLFLNKLLLVSVFDKDLDDQITFLIKEMDIIDKSVPLKLMNNTIFTQIKSWFQSDKGTYLTHDHVIAFIFELKSLIYITNKIKSLPILNETKAYELPSESLENDLVLFKITNKETYDLHLLIICQALLKLITENKTSDQEELLAKILFVDPNASLNIIKSTITSFKIPKYVYLIIPVFDDVHKFNDIKSDLEDAIDVQKNKSYKKIIIITDNLDADVENTFLSNFVPIKHNIKLSNFSDQVQKKILWKHITYQGSKIPLKYVIRYQKLIWDDIIDERTLLELLSIDKKIIINNTFENYEVIPFYVNRTFIEIDEKDYSDYFENTIRQSINGLSEKNFCSKITEESNNKFINILDGPGMGKSTILNRLCQLLRKTQYWIIKINLNENTKILFKLSKENRKSITLDEFLDLLQYPVKTRFEKNLFNIPKNVILLLDALDEICPDYSDLVLDSLTNIASNKNIRKIVLTSRPHPLKDLKVKKIECSVFVLQHFSKEQYIDYLSKLWDNKLNIESDQSNYKKISDFANNLTSSLYMKGYKIETFMGIPLHTKMIAVVFEKHCKNMLDKHTKTENNLILPKKFNLKWLYDEFIEQTKDIFINEKCNASGNACVMEMIENKFNDAITDHIKEALKLEIPQKFHHCFELISSPKCSEEKHLFKMGLIIKPVDCVYFSHKTWSEYFAAQHIIDQLLDDEKCRRFIENFRSEGFIEFIHFYLAHNIFIPKMLTNHIKSVSAEFTYNFIEHALGEKFIPCSSRNLEYYPLLFSFLRNCGYENLFRLCSYTVLRNLHCHYEKVLLKLLKEANNINLTRSRDITPLHLAENLVENTNLRHRTGITPLHLACASNSTEIVELLISKGHPIDALDDEGNSILHYAVFGGRTDNVKCLLNKGHTVSVQDKKGRTPLYPAIYQSQVDIVQLLIKKGHPVDIADNSGRTPLHYASHCGQLKVIELLLEQGHLNYVSDEIGITPLFEAARLGKAEIIQLLVEKGHPFDIDDYSGEMLCYAARHGNIWFLETLVNKGQSIDISDGEGKTPLHFAACGNEKTTEFLIKLGHPINITDNAGVTPLHCAAESGNVKIADILLKNDHQLNVSDDVGGSPLHYAVKWNRWDMVEFLLSKGYLVDACDHLGRSPLHYAARWALSNIGAFLINNGHPVCVRDKKGRTPLHYEVLSYNINVKGELFQIIGKISNIDYLLRKNHPIDIKDQYGKTPLHYAAIKDLTTIAKMLLRKGHPVEVTDNHGNTPLYYAEKYGFQETSTCLLTYYQ